MTSKVGSVWAESQALQPLGTLTLRFLGDDITITGGPYLAKPPGYIGIKMAEEIKALCHISIPTKDFQTPPRDRMYIGMLTALEEHFCGSGRQRRLYVGCMAGRGRTGLFLATMAYLSGIEDPVEYVRERYYPHAVETEEQERFVRSFDRAQFRYDLIRELHRGCAINFTWSRLRRMSWPERLTYLRVRAGL